MRRYAGLGLTTLTSLAFAAAFPGCGGAGGETPPPPLATGADVGQDKGKDQAKGKDVPGTVVESDQKVDPKKAIDIVKGDIDGGEKQAGGTPEEFLWDLTPETSQIKDEPLTVDAPRGLPDLAAYIPPSNPLTKGKVELGKQLYFDPRISLDGTVSCATCHNPNKGWTDNLKTSVGIDGQVGGRNAPTVLNTAYGATMFWDGRAASLEAQSQGPPQNPIEMGNQSYKQIIERLRGISGYREQFARVFGTDVTLDGVAKAIASFERVTALSGDSKYDRYAAGEVNDLNESEKRGMVLFGLRQHPDDETKLEVTLKKAECTSCHAGANFTDEKFHNLGVGWVEGEKKFADLGRVIIDAVGAKNPADSGAFKTPTVRDAEKTGPYMHDGSLKTLEEVVEHYNKGGNPNPALDKDMKPLNLTDGEKADVVAFMKALNGARVPVKLPTLPAGPDGKTPDPGDALAPPKPKTALSADPHAGLVR